MSKPRVQIELIVDTAAHANTISTNFDTQLVGKDIFSTEHKASGRDEDGRPFFSADIRFNSEADRDAIRDWVVDAMRDNIVTRDWVTRAHVTIHLCTHDDVTVQDCTTTSYSRTEK